MGTDGITIERRVGRLLEVRSWGTPGGAELEALREGLARITAQPPPTLITVVDVRKTSITSDSVAGAIINLMVQYNQRTERAAYLLGGQSLFAVQMEAMVLQAHNPERRVFRRREELETWLAELCVPEEKARLAAFLDG
jgi:hypothetical protein